MMAATFLCLVPLFLWFVQHEMPLERVNNQVAVEKVVGKVTTTTNHLAKFVDTKWAIVVSIDFVHNKGDYQGEMLVKMDGQCVATSKHIAHR